MTLIRSTLSWQPCLIVALDFYDAWINRGTEILMLPLGFPLIAWNCLKHEWKLNEHELSKGSLVPSLKC